MIDKTQLPKYDGFSAYDGALRFFDPEDTSWKYQWGKYYGELMPNIKIFAADAFGTVYGLLDNGSTAIFWTETGEIEGLGVDLDEFFELVYQDPDGTINLSLYQAAVEKFGNISVDKHFAFKVETALGGQLSIDNIVLMDSNDHFKALSKIAKQIKNIPEGQVINNILIED